MAKTLGELYLEAYDGSVQRYHEGLAAGHRIGQAFFNALSERDQLVLTGSDHDPYYSNEAKAVEKTVDFLVHRDVKNASV